MADVTHDAKTASAVFVDVPNVVGKDNSKISYFKWERLSQDIARSEVLVGTTLMHAGVYIADWHDQMHLGEWPRRLLSSFGRTSFTSKIRIGDDIDSLIVNDMWSIAATWMMESTQEGLSSFPMRLRYVLVSGDSDYLHTIKDMRSAYGQNIEIELIVYSWMKSLSSELMDAADRCIYLEEVRGFTRQLVSSGQQ